jgi:catechol 2,3-dioxygenase-like lactoylglutathione lyase family enzyme
MIRRLAHLCFITDDLPRMAEFYTEKLGLPVKITFRNADGETFGYYFDCGDSSFIEVFDRKLKQKQWGGSLEPLGGRTGYDHFCCEVTALADFKATLESRGVKVSEIRSGMDGSLQAWTNDPDGNAIELMEYTARSLQIQRQAGVAE